MIERLSQCFRKPNGCHILIIDMQNRKRINTHINEEITQERSIDETCKTDLKWTV